MNALYIKIPVELYSDESKAEFLLSSAITHEGYEEAKREVMAMGLNPKEIAHYKYCKKEEKKHQNQLIK